MTQTIIAIFYFERVAKTREQKCADSSHYKRIRINAEVNSLTAANGTRIIKDYRSDNRRYVS